MMTGISPLMSRLSCSTAWMRWLLLLALAGLMVGPIGCKSKKKLAEEKAKAEAEARAAQIDRLKAKVKSLMADPVRDMAELQQREERLAQIRNLNLGDPALDSLIAQAEDFLAAERERLIRESQPEPEPVDQQAELKNSLDRSFRNIANASSTEAADREIDRLLGKFASEETPVLIVISQQGGVKDYDRPTTIVRYLNYLKDQRKSPDQVSDVVLDANGRITELELVKSL